VPGALPWPGPYWIAVKIALLNQPQDPIVAADEQRGSVAIVNWELARRLSERHEVIVYAPGSAGRARAEQWRGIEIRRTGFSAKHFHKALQLVAGRFHQKYPYAFSPLYHREYFLQVARDLTGRSVDVVHFPVQVQFGGLFKRAVPRAKIVLHAHQDELATADYEFLRRHLAHFDSVVSVSDFVTERARARFPELASRMHTIGNGVDVERFRPAMPPSATGFRPTRLLFVGRIAPDKGVHLLAQAFNTLARERPDLELTLVGKAGMMPFDVISILLKGDPALEHLREFYGRSPAGWLTKEVLGQRNSYTAHLRSLLSPEAAQRVHFRGTIPLAELLRVYRESDLLVLPSIWQESYGLPVAEAMASGVPVLASRSGGVPELVEDGVTGRLVPRLDPDALLSAMRELLSDARRLREMGQAARLRAESLLTWQRSAQRLERIYSGLAPEENVNSCPSSRSLP
jgi:glycosyltransferase involved in cell wall biosynthesis